MASFNKVILLGNLTRSPELKTTQGGLSICKFGIAVNRRFSTKEGEQRDEVTYIDIDAFGRQAETIAKYLTKGSAIHVEGRLKLDQWETQDGEKRSKLGVVLEGFQFVGGREGASESVESRSGGSNRPDGKKQSQSGLEGDYVDDSVPF